MTTKTLTIPGGRALEDNATHTNRFEIASETSDRIYTVAQNKSTGEWGCSCPALRLEKPIPIWGGLKMRLRS